MKNKGFTLIELLGVAIILAVIGLIVFPTVMKTIEKNRQKSLKESAKNIIRSSEYFRASNNYHFDGPYAIESEIIPLEKAEQWIYGIIYEVNNVIKIENLYDGDYCLSGDEQTLEVIKGECDFKPSSTCLIFDSYEAKITGLLESEACSRSLIIPMEINGTEIVSIDSFAFYNTNLTNIINQTGKAFDWGSIITGSSGPVTQTGSVGGITITN